MNKYKLSGLGLLVFAVTLAFAETSYAISNDEWLDIDMEFKSTNGDLTITCTKDSDVTLNMLMTVINYDTKEFIVITDSSFEVISETVSLVDDSMIQVFCEYTNDNGDKAGYAIMRTFTNA